MRPLRLLALGLAAYAAFLLATLPAALVAPRFAAATQGRATLADVTGTAWNGSAIVDIRTRDVSLRLDRVRWRFLPSRLAAGRIAFSVTARLGGLEASGEIARGPLAWRIDDLSGSGDASALAAAWPLAAPLQPGGRLAIAAPRLAWDGRNASGFASAEWHDATLSLSAVRPLGSWRAELVAEGPAAKVAVSTLAGPLRISGNGTLAIPGRLAFSGEARAEAARESDLAPVLGLLGARRPDGAWALQVR